MSWTKRVKHPSEVLKKGDEVEAVVLNIDAENQRLSLGLKQLATDMWDEFFAHHKVGDIVEGKIVRLTNFGAFVELPRASRAWCTSPSWTRSASRSPRSSSSPATSSR